MAERVVRTFIDTMIGFVLIPSDDIMRAPPLISRFLGVVIKYHTVPLDSGNIIASTYLKAYKRDAQVCRCGPESFRTTL